MDPAIIQSARTTVSTRVPASLVSMLLLVAACSDAASPDPHPLNDIHLLALETFDGSGQAVHPDAAVTPLAWGGSEIGLFATPYPGGNASFENPSLYTKQSLLDWRVPPGVVNPIERPVEGYLSDPDEVFNPETNELWLYYRGVNTENRIFLVRGSAPASWSPPTLVASGINHAIVSPSVVRRARDDWMMWSVNSGTSGCTSRSTTVELRSSADGINWSAPVTTDLSESELFAWHIDVEWIPARNEFWAIYNVKVPGSCTTSALHFARSFDGIHWAIEPGPVLTRGAIPAFDDIVYRGSLLYDETSNTVTLWYSGARFEKGGYNWRIATERMGVADFIERVSAVAHSGLTPPGETTAPPLTNADAP
jgi:hypothetical protein